MKQHKPRSVQRQAVLALFETMDSVTKYEVSQVIGLGLVSAANLLNSMCADGVIARGSDRIGFSGNPLRVYTKKHKSVNRFLTMQIRRRTNKDIGIADAAW